MPCLAKGLYESDSDDCLIEVASCIVIDAPTRTKFLKVKLQVIHKRLHFPFAGERFKWYTIPMETVNRWRKI